MINQTEINGLRDGQEASRIKKKKKKRKDDGERFMQVRGDDRKSSQVMVFVVFWEHYSMSSCLSRHFRHRVGKRKIIIKKNR